jgi:hypothetical protein
MMGFAQNPFSGQAGLSMDQMLATGMPVDVSGIGEAALRRANTAFGDLSGAAMERAAMSGGLSGSGISNTLANISGGLADEAYAKMFEAGVGAEENAMARIMQALGLNLQGQQAGAAMAGQVGGLEQGAAGLNLQALLGGGNLAATTDDQSLRALQSAGGLATGIDQMGYGAKATQAGAGQDFINSLMSGGGGLSAGYGSMNPHQLASYILAAGGANNQVANQAAYNKLGLDISANKYMAPNPYLNPINAPAAASSGGADGGTLTPNDRAYYNSVNAALDAPNLLWSGKANPIKVGGLAKERYLDEHFGGGGGGSVGTGSTNLSSPEEFRAKADALDAERAAIAAANAGQAPPGTPPGQLPSVPMTPWGQQIPTGVINWGMGG